ncbi:MAG: site-2 protease family protein [Oscillospiraceae bacterium]|nr:site-2 protease family protein [Oscillospiraceae bacterium]
MTIFYILLAIFLFGVLIFVHEFGHFICAKLSGVQVNEFSLFMGPAIFQRKKGETTYSLRCIPIGGYCAMEGEDEASDNPRAFGNAKLWKKLLILVAGSGMNFIAGFLITVLVVTASAGNVPTTQLSGFQEGSSLASETGLQVGDRFYSIDGERIYIFGDIPMFLDRNESNVYDIVVLRDGQKVSLHDVEMKRQNYEGEMLYGFSCAREEKDIGSVLSNSWNSCRNFTRLVRLGLQDLFTGAVGMDEMSGPVGIVSAVTEGGAQAESTGDGVLYVLYLFAFIAINLAVMNLLPIPALDGGRVVALLITAVAEKILRRKVNPKYEMYLHGAGMVLLLAFMAFITFKDIFKLFGG